MCKSRANKIRKKARRSGGETQQFSYSMEILKFDSYWQELGLIRCGLSPDPFQLNPDSAVAIHGKREAQSFRNEVDGSVPLSRCRSAVLRRGC